MKKALLLLTFISFAAFAQDNEYHLDEEYVIDADGTIALSSDDANVTITGASRSTVHVVVHRKVTTVGIVRGEDNFSMDISENNGNLQIRERQSGNISVTGYSNEEYEITIEAPQGVSLQLRGDDDDFAISNIHGAIDLKNDDGDAVLENCGGSHFSFVLDDGNITLDQGKGELYIRTDDGDAYISNGHFTTVDASIDDGKLMIETSLDNAGSYTLAGSDADIDLEITAGGGEFDIAHDDVHITSSEAFGLLEKDESFTRLRLPNGNAQISIKADDGDIRLSTR